MEDKRKEDKRKEEKGRERSKETKDEIDKERREDEAILCILHLHSLQCIVNI